METHVFAIHSDTAYARDAAEQLGKHFFPLLTYGSVPCTWNTVVDSDYTSTLQQRHDKAIFIVLADEHIVLPRDYVAQLRAFHRHAIVTPLRISDVDLSGSEYAGIQPLSKFNQSLSQAENNDSFFVHCVSQLERIL